MSKAAITWLVVALIVIVGGGALLVANSHSNNTNKTNGTNSMDMNSHSSSNNSSSSSSSTQPTATNSVTIENFAFSPANITVKKGSTVTWTNNDSVAHTVTETDGQNGPKSSSIDPGKTFTFTFDTAGTYKYNCSIHPSMTGSVTVTE